MKNKANLLGDNRFIEFRYISTKITENFIKLAMMTPFSIKYLLFDAVKKKGHFHCILKNIHNFSIQLITIPL